MSRPYYEQDGITIYHGDCREVLPSLDSSSADLVFADPPYNYGIQYGLHDDNMPRDDYRAWCAEWFALARSIFRRVVITPGNGNLDIWFAIQKPTAIGCWYKPGNFASSVIGWEEWEPYLYWHGGNKGLLGGSSVIRAPIQQHRRITEGHPCPKPLGFMLRLLKKTRTEAVLDPFMGSGTTLRAAKDLGRRAIGIEIEERYCEMAARRLCQQVLPFEVTA